MFIVPSPMDKEAVRLSDGRDNRYAPTRNGSTAQRVAGRPAKSDNVVARPR